VCTYRPAAQIILHCGGQGKKAIWFHECKCHWNMTAFFSVVPATNPFIVLLLHILTTEAYCDIAVSLNMLTMNF
jgi:hypothetical protein